MNAKEKLLYEEQRRQSTIREIKALKEKGLSTIRISDKLNLSETTVRRYIYENIPVDPKHIP